MRKAGKHPKGQALVLFLGFAAAMIGILLVAFNSGQVTNAKMRAMNAADAAAYSGAVWEARSLNFQAYMNRAIVVNEVAIAQSVSLRSWLEYLNIFARNVSIVTAWIPGVDEVTYEISQVVDQINDAAQTGLSIAEDVFRKVGNIEQVVQEGFNASSVVVAADLASTVAKQNGSEMSVGGMALQVQNEREWLKFTETYSRSKAPTGSSGDGRKRLREVALNSRDGFTRKRDNVFFDNALAELRKQGGTDLVDYDAWVGLDSMKFCFLKNCTPVAWGGAQAYSTNGVVRTIGRHGDINQWNDVDGRLARRTAQSSQFANSLNRSPFPNYRDLQDLSGRTPLTLPFAVEVLVKESNIPTANKSFGAKAVLVDGTKLEHDANYQGNNSGVFALSQACVTFERPFTSPKNGNATELPSLFNPYWRPSLATEGAAARVIVDVAKGLRAPLPTSLAGSCGS